MPNFSGIWTVTQQMQARGASTWPATPGAPTIGTATQASPTSVSVPFTAPACAGSPAVITGYLATSTPGCFTNTGASSPIVVSGLSSGTAYTFKVKATNATGYGPCSAASNSVTPVVSCATYTTAGSYTFVAPIGVTSTYAAVAIGGGGGGWFNCPDLTSGGGGGLGYKNGIVLTPGNSYDVVVGAAGTFSGGGNGGQSYFVCSGYLSGGGGTKGSSGGGYVGTGGGNGGAGRSVPNPTGSGTRASVGGGGAGGYTGAGGTGGRSTGCGSAGAAGSGGGAGGGYAPPSGCICSTYGSGAGGGTGLFGSGTSGAAGVVTQLQRGGRGGSGGGNGTCSCVCTGGIGGGTYGGGNSFWRSQAFGTNGNPARNGAVRIVWCSGGSRGTPSFPSTNVGP